VRVSTSGSSSIIHSAPQQRPGRRFARGASPRCRLDSSRPAYALPIIAQMQDSQP
jgi:hypothetical protein